MRSRHLFLLASLAALAAGLWVVPSGLALRKPVIQQVFGPKLVRLEAIERTPINGSTDWRIDRGAIVSVSSTQLTLREADGRIQAVSLASTTEVVRLGRIVSVARLAPHGNAPVTGRANGAAQGVAGGRAPAAGGGRTPAGGSALERDPSHLRWSPDAAELTLPALARARHLACERSGAVRRRRADQGAGSPVIVRSAATPI